MAEKYNFNQNDSDSDDDIAYLYDEVTKAIRNGLPLSAFDIDTLIDVHDYAYDIHDDFVADELMSNVLTRSPKCLPMLERKAMAYLRVGDILAAQTVASRLPKHSFIYKLISAQSQWDTDNWRECYRGLLGALKQNSIDDFGAVSIIDFALDNDDIAHLVDILSELLPYIRYPEDFLYDLSGILVDNHNYEEAARALQELTTIQSFNIDYWLQLADIYINQLDNYEEGQSALDYALAISPHSPRGLLLLGELLVKTGGPAQSIIDIADRLIADKSLRSQAYFLKAGVYIREKNVEEAINSLDACFDDASDKLNHLLLILTLAGGNVDGKHLAQLKQEFAGMDEAAIEAWLLRNRKVIDSSMSNLILKTIDESGCGVTDEVFDMILFSYYAAGDYAKVVLKYEARYSGEAVTGAGFLYVFSLIRTGYTDKARLRRLTDDITASITTRYQNPSPTEAMTLIEAIKTGLSIKAFLEATEGTDYNICALDKIDFFVSVASDVN